MDRAVVMFARLSLSVLLLLSLWHGTHGVRMLNARITGELPPCKDVPGRIPNWDCYDPPLTPLPPCNFWHQNRGIDCSTVSQIAKSPPAHKAKEVADTQSDRAQQWPEPLPPCKDVPGGIQNWDCYDPPLTPLPPCDFKHQNPGIDCSTDSQIPKPPPASKAKAVTDTQRNRAQQWPEPLPPCNFPGAIPGWDCFDPPTHDLPPCDYKHQRVGIDCWPKSPPAGKLVAKVRPVADIGASDHDIQSTTTQSAAHHVQVMLPPCKDVRGGIQNWNCYDPPSTPLPPCDFKHQNPGIDCSTDSQIPKPPPASKAKAVTDISTAGDACVGSECWRRVPWPGALP